MRRPIVLSTMSIAALLICGVMLAGCGAMGGREEASKPKPELTTVAGDGGSKLGDGGPATKAGLCGPTDVTLDAEGNMYISDTGEYCIGPGGDTIRKVEPDGTITTVAGTGEAGFSGDGGLATKAKLNNPFAVAVDREGNLYISGDYRIRKVDKDGIITTFAGTGDARHSGDGGPATSAQLREPDQMTFDDRGNLYVGDFTSVRKIDPSGTITTVAGTGRFGFSGYGGEVDRQRRCARWKRKHLHLRYRAPPDPHGEQRRHHSHGRGNGQRRLLGGWRPGHQGCSEPPNRHRPR